MILIKRNLLFAFVFFLPLYIRISTLILVLLVVISILTLLRAEAKVDLKFTPYLAPMLLYFILGCSLFFSENIEFRYLEQKASLLAFPLIFFTIPLDSRSYKKTLHLFVLGCLTAVVLCYVNAIYNATTWVDGKIVFQAVVNNNFSFFYSVVRDGNYFFSSFFSIFHDTIYFAIFINTAIAIILSLSLWERSKWFIVLLLLFPMVIFQLSSKIGIITCFLIFVLYAFSRIKRTDFKILLCLFMVVIGFFFFQYNPRGKIMIKKFEKDGLSIDPNERFGYTLRLMSWDTAFELIKENPIMGVGIGDVTTELNNKYSDKGYQTPLKQNLNAHSQFLQISLESGVFGLAVILWMFYYLFRSLLIYDHLHFFNMAFLTTIFLGFLFESTLSRYSGISFFMLFYCMIMNRPLDVSKKMK